MGLVGTYGNYCGSGISRLRISPNGNVNPCELFREVVFGNIYTDSVDSIFNNRGNWIEKVKKGIETNKCSACKNRQYCIQCLGMFELENGDMAIPSSFLCEWATLKDEQLRNK